METNSKVYLNRKAAAAYLFDRYGFCGSWRTLSKLACLGEGPPYSIASSTALYRPDDLDAWAITRIGAPAKSTSEHKTCA